MFSSRSVQIAAVFSDVFGQALPNLCRSFYNETKAEMFFSVFAVALLAEGVDRNCGFLCALDQLAESPSSRRAWIEIRDVPKLLLCGEVALLAEGVDRNREQHLCRAEKLRSPSSRRAWIEICAHWPLGADTRWSPSSRRAWIEIRCTRRGRRLRRRRPPRGGRG